MNKKLKDLYKLALLIEKRLEGTSLTRADKDNFCEVLDLCGVEKLSKLAVRVKEGMNLDQFVCFVVPIERELNNKITDTEILVETDDLEIGRGEAPKNSLIIVLDNIRSPFNMGAAVRTCDALGVFELIITGYTPDLDNERVKKISMGAWKNLNVIKLRDLEKVRDYLLGKGYQMVSVETTRGAQVIHDVKLESKTALVFGNERFGISKKDLLLSDGVVRLPVFGVKNSLNINAALTACGYEWVRQNG